MNTINVRTSVANDADAVHRLLCLIADIHRNGRPDMFPGLKSKYTVDEVKTRLSKENNGVFVAVLDNNVVGYIFCDIIKEGDGLTLYVDDLCVDPSVQKSGVGTALMDYASQYGKDNNCRYLILNVWEFNSSALDFYKKYGLKTRTRHLEMPL